MKEFRKRYWYYEVALCASFIQLIHSPIAYTADVEDVLGAAKVETNTAVDTDTYTVNFNNVSIIELIRFTSKITRLNFVFDEADLPFSVTVVSKEAVSSKSMMAVLSQVLRMHDLILLEQGGNVLITKSTKVNQIPPIVSADLPDSQAGNAAIVTRVFQIKNANINSIAAIIRPMSSAGALIEISPETRQLIVTDIATNVDQIAQLLSSLDAPHSPLDIEMYVVKHISPLELITLTQQIVTPFTEGNPLIFVPQAETNSIFLVSTPHLIERAITVMEDLDLPAKTVVVGKQGIAGKNILIYQVLHRVPHDLILDLRQIADTLKVPGVTPSSLEVAIDGVQEVQESNSLMFVADPETTLRLREILLSLDTPSAGRTSFYIYKVQLALEEQLTDSLKQMQERLQAAPRPDEELIHAIGSMKWIKETNAVIFTGSDVALKKLADILPTFDVSPRTALTGKRASSRSSFFIYQPEYRTGQDLKNEIAALETKLKESGLTDPALLETLGTMQWIASANLLVFTGDPQSLERVQGMLKSVDTAQQVAKTPSREFFLYKLQSASCHAVLIELKNIASKLSTTTVQNQNIVAAINKIECIPSNNSMLITAATDTVEQIKSLIEAFDTPVAAGGLGGAKSFFIYKPKFLPVEDVQSALSHLSDDLQASGLNDPELFQTLETMKYVSQTHSLLFTGSQGGLDKVQHLLNGIDTSAALGAIQSIGNVTFLLYKIQTASADKLINSLKTFTSNLQGDTKDKQLIETIDSVKWIKDTNSLLFTGNSHTLEQVEELVKKFDLPSSDGSAPIERHANTFILYNPKYLSGDELICILNDFLQNLMHSGVSDPGLFDTINNLKWIDKTSSLLISGNTESIEKVHQLLVKFDMPGKGSSVPSIEAIDNVSFLVYKLQYHPGTAIQTALIQVAQSLGKGSTAPAALVDAINSLQWIEVTNSLLCTGQQDVLVKLKDLIQNLDIPLRQVFIEVLVIETGLTNTQNFGLQWGGQVQYLNKTIMQTGNFPLSTSPNSQLPATAFPQNLQAINGTATPNNTSIPFTTGFDLGVIGDIIMHKGKSFISLGSLLNAIQLDSDTTILLNPKIITQDNRQSTIFSGSNIPYTGSLITNNSSASTVQTANIEYRDVGVNLTITPILGDGDVITMDIVQDISNVIGPAGNTPSTQVTGITTSHTHMETRVHVPNNHFVALSGMINDSKVHYRTAIPCLGGLPVVGMLFSENDRTASKNNVIIFVRPQIVNTYQEFKEITEHQEWLYKDNARLPVLKEEFDEGIDMVKLPSNETFISK